MQSWRGGSVSITKLMVLSTVENAELVRPMKMNVMFSVSACMGFSHHMENFH